MHLMISCGMKRVLCSLEEKCDKHGSKLLVFLNRRNRLGRWHVSRSIRTRHGKTPFPSVVDVEFRSRTKMECRIAVVSLWLVAVVIILHAVLALRTEISLALRYSCAANTGVVRIGEVLWRGHWRA